MDGVVQVRLKDFLVQILSRSYTRDPRLEEAFQHCQRYMSRLALSSQGLSVEDNPSRPQAQQHIAGW